MMWKRVRMILGLASLILILSGVATAEDALPLEHWVRLAFEKNEDYQLFVADHELALQEMDLAQRLGIKEAHLSLSPLTMGTQGFKYNYGLGVQFSGSLPKKIQFSGSNSLSTDQQGRPRLSGNLQVGFNPRILWEQAEDWTDEFRYIDQIQRWHEARLNLVTAVLNQYIPLIRLQLQAEVAQGKQVLAGSNLLKAKQEYEAGLISLLDLYAVEDAERAANKACEDLPLAKAQAVREFLQLFGGSPEEAGELLVVGVGELTLPLPGVEALLDTWDSVQAERVIEGLYPLEKARQALLQTEDAVKQAKTSREWRFQLSAGLNYDTAGVLDVSGTLGFSKELYNPEGRLNLRQAEIQLERQKLTFQETKNRMLSQVRNQVEAVWIAQAGCLDAQDDLQVAIERDLRVQKQFEQGFLPERDVLQQKISLLEKQIALLQAIETEIKARLALAQLLGYDEFVEAE